MTTCHLNLTSLGTLTLPELEVTQLRLTQQVEILSNLVCAPSGAVSPFNSTTSNSLCLNFVAKGGQEASTCERITALGDVTYDDMSFKSDITQKSLCGCARQFPNGVQVHHRPPGIEGVVHESSIIQA
jgi:hypothetical protein